MSAGCPEPDELLRLLDGEVTENRAAELRAHLAGCARCAEEWRTQERLVARLAAPVPGLGGAERVQAVLDRIDSTAAPLSRAPEASRAPSRARRRWMAGLTGLAAAAALVLFLWPATSRRVPEFAARGGAPSWAQRVGVELWEVQSPPRKLEEGAAVAPGTPFLATYRNLGAAPAYLLAFAIDARGEVHWLYPAYEDPRTDPLAVALEPSRERRVLPETVVLDGLPAGALRLVTLIARAPLPVSRVEALPPAERTRAGLRARFPEAHLEELALTVKLPAPGRPENRQP